MELQYWDFCSEMEMRPAPWELYKECRKKEYRYVRARRLKFIRKSFEDISLLSVSKENKMRESLKLLHIKMKICFTTD